MFDRQIRETEKSRANLLAAIEHGQFSPALVERLNEVDMDLKKLKDSREAVKPAEVELPADLPKIYRNYVTDLIATLSDEEVAGRAGDALHEMVDRIVVVHDPMEGHQIEIQGSLVSMLSVGNKNAAGIDAAANSLKLVAGVGFEPTTFRL